MKEDKLLNGFKIDLSWVVGESRRVLESRLVNKLSSLIYQDKRITSQTREGREHYNKDYVIVYITSRLHKLTAKSVFINKDKLKNFDFGNEKTYNTFEELPLKEINLNKALTAVSFKELQYGLTRECAEEIKKNELEEKQKEWFEHEKLKRDKEYLSSLDRVMSHVITPAKLWNSFGDLSLTKLKWNIPSSVEEKITKPTYYDSCGNIPSSD